MCISLTFHGISVGGQVISMPVSTQRLCISSTLSTHMDIQTPWSGVPVGESLNVWVCVPLPRPPCPSWHRKISQSPQHTEPKPTGSPHSKPIFQPSFSNQTNVFLISETFNMGVNASNFISLIPRPGVFSNAALVCLLSLGKNTKQILTEQH